MWNILEHAYGLINSNQDVCMVTLVESKGSTYRRPGAKMIVSEDNQIIGAISGGCLENDVAQHAQDVIQSNQAKMIHYELNDDVIFGLGLGCGGSISLLLEPLSPFWLKPIIDAKEEVVIAKVIESNNEQVELGTHSVYINGKMEWENKDLGISERLLMSCRKVVEKRIPVIEEANINGDKVRLFLDFIPLPYQLVVFGAGDDAIPVVNLAIQADFKVIVVDSNPHQINNSRFPGSTFMQWKGKETVSKLDVNKNTACIIMSHHIEKDAEALESFFHTEAYYIGVLGPKHRFNRMVERHCYLSKDSLMENKRIFSPVGLNIGSETPSEIAISIVSEIIAVRNNKAAGFLREKTGGIH